MSKISRIFNTFLVIGCMVITATISHATTVTELIQVTIPQTMGAYQLGDILNITATYDNAGTARHTYYDGTNKIAEFGKGDDTLYRTFKLTSIANRHYTLLSDATISFSGLKSLPAGASSYDRSQYNASFFSIEESDPGKQIILMYEADNIFFALITNLDNNGVVTSQNLYLNQYYTTSSGIENVNMGGYTVPAPSAPPFATSTLFGNQTPAQAPEPASMLLFGLGLAGLAGVRKKFKK